MAKVKISEFDVNPDNNTDINNINIAEGCAPSGINNAIRQLMSDLKEFQTGAGGDPFNGAVNGTVGATTPATGAFTTLSASSTVSGTGFSTYLASPPAIGGTAAAAGAFTSLSASGAFSANGGTTLGDASGDALTINSSAVSIPNGLNFDSNTFVIDATNNQVGIGTSSPLARFNVQRTGIGSETAILLSRTSTSVNDEHSITWRANDLSVDYAAVTGLMTGATAGVLTFKTISSGSTPTERMKIDSSGNVGIGTSSPAEKLDINGNLKMPAASYIDIGSSAGLNTLTLGKTSTSTGDIARQLVISSRYSSANRTLTLTAGNGKADSTIAASSALLFATGGTTERMRIDSAGLVGIGTSSPSYRLDVQNSSNAYIRSLTTTATPIGALYGASSSLTGGLVGTITNHPFLFLTNDTERMRINTSGNVGIGTIAPSAKLEVLANSTDTVFTDQNYPAESSGITILNTSATDSNFTALTFLASNAAATNQSASIIAQSISSGFAPNLIFTQRTASNVNTERMRITSGGNVLIGGTSTTVHPALNRFVSVQSSTNNDIVGYNLYINDGANGRRGSLFLDDNAGVFGLDVTASSGVPDIVFRNNGTEKVRITDTYLRMASGSGGIQFNGDTAAANALDDYEEGTWTPAIETGATQSITYASRGGKYTKIGRQVFCQGFINISSAATYGAFTHLRLSGLPFAVNTAGGSSLSFTYGGTYNTNSYFQLGDITGAEALSNGSAEVFLQRGQFGGTSTVYVLTSNLNTTGFVSFTIQYTV